MIHAPISRAFNTLGRLVEYFKLYYNLRLESAKGRR